MAINPNFQQDIANAFVATPDQTGSEDFGPQGDGIVFHAPGPAFVKFVAQAGVTYTVSSDQPTGNLIVLGPNGNPIGGGGGITAPNFPEATFSFTPNQTGLYFAEVIGNAGMVANKTVDHILITAQNNQGGVPTTLPGALDPFGLNESYNVINGGINIANGNNGQQLYLHQPDGNGNGLATANVTSPTTLAPFEVDPGFNLPLNLNPPSGNNTPTGNLNPPSGNTPPNGSITPNELSQDGKPLTWVGATDAPGKPGDPTTITVAIANSNYPSDGGTAPPFSNPLPDNWKPLLQAAEDVWELVANVKFVNVPDTPDTGGSHPQSPDIRVGLSDLSKYLGISDQNQFLSGDTWYYTTGNHFQPDVLLAVEDPAEHGVTALENGDYQYAGTGVTVFQTMIKDLGYALGLGNNPSDKSSIMATLGSNNPLPDANDIAAIQALYGAPKPGAVTFSQQEITTLQHLIPGLTN